MEHPPRVGLTQSHPPIKRFTIVETDSYNPPQKLLCNHQSCHLQCHTGCCDRFCVRLLCLLTLSFTLAFLFAFNISNFLFLDVWGELCICGQCVYLYSGDFSFVLIKESVGLHWEFELVSVVVIMI